MLKGSRNQTLKHLLRPYLASVLLVSLVLIVFQGFDNCEDVVTGASERRAMSKANYFSGMFDFFNVGRTHL